MQLHAFIATVIYVFGIAGLFWLDRGHEGSRMSKALWIPWAWLFLVSSRPLSMWLGLTPNFDAANATEAYVEGSPFDRAVFTFLLVAALAVLASRMTGVTSMLRRNALILLFFSFCAVSVIWSDFSFVALKRFTKAIGDLAMVLIILTESDPLAALKRLVTRLGFLVFPLSILCIKYYPQIGRRLTNSWIEEPIGLTLQKNQLGLDCMIYGIVFLWMLWSVYREREDPGGRRRLLAYGTIIGMIVWLLAACQSMTSITGLAMAGGVMWLARRPSRKPAAVHLLVLVMLGISLIALFFDPGGNLVEALGKDRTFSGRTFTWNLVLGMHTNPLLGTGFESFWLGDSLAAMRKAWPNFPINEAHNGYIEVYLNLGLIGVALVALLLLTGYRRAMAAFRADPEKGSLLLGLLLTIIFESLTEAAFRMMTLSWVFLLLVVLAACPASSSEIVRRPVRAGVTATDEEQVYARAGC